MMCIQLVHLQKNKITRVHARDEWCGVGLNMIDQIYLIFKHLGDSDHHCWQKQRREELKDIK